jgi:protein phosphatase PTC1
LQHSNIKYRTMAEEKVADKVVEEKVAYTSVKEAGVAADRGRRRKMEDAHAIIDNFGGLPHQGYFGVFDGHGGKEAADWCKDKLHQFLLDEIKDLADADFTEDRMKEVLTAVFTKADLAMKPEIPSAGACVVIALIRQVVVDNQPKRVLFVANAGDAAAILSRGGEAVKLTVDHNANDEKEAQFVRDAGGFVNNGRVNGMIAITRSLGDHLMKEYLRNLPYVTAVELKPEDTTLVLACDGLFETVGVQEVIDMTKEDLPCDQLSRKLLVKAIQSGSQDNISVITIRL